MFEFETVQRSEGAVSPTRVDFSSPAVDDSALLEKVADEFGAAAVEILEDEPSDGDTDIETLLDAAPKPVKTAKKPGRQGKRAEDADRSTDPIALYAKDVRKYALLTFEDEVRLSSEYRAGNAKS